MIKLCSRIDRGISPPDRSSLQDIKDTRPGFGSSLGLKTVTILQISDRLRSYDPVPIVDSIQV
jgi:hypothetical protein